MASCVGSWAGSGLPTGTFQGIYASTTATLPTEAMHSLLTSVAALGAAPVPDRGAHGVQTGERHRSRLERCYLGRVSEYYRAAISRKSTRSWLRSAGRAVL